MTPIVNVLNVDVLDVTIDGHFIAWLSQIEAESGDFYTLVIDWEQWDKYDPGYGIPGFDMEARKLTYVRDYIPEFLSCYLPPIGREDIPFYMKKYNMTEYTLWEFAKVSGRPTGDVFRLRPSTTGYLKA